MEKRKQDNWYRVVDHNGKPTTEYIFASNIQEARKIFKSDPRYAKYRYFGRLERVYNGGVRG